MLVLYGDRCGSQKMFILALEASKWLASGCNGYLTKAVDTTKTEKNKLNDVRMVSEFMSVFLKDLPSLPSRSRGDVGNSSITGTTPIFKSTILKGTSRIEGILDSIPRFA